MRLCAHRYNSPAQLRILRQRNTGAEAEQEFPKNPMGLDPQEGFAKSDEAGDMQDRIWRELVKLHTINKKKPTEEFMGRERKTTQQKSKEHHPIAARGLGDAFSAGEDDLLPSDEESIPLGLEQIEFFEF
jgi:hypothetical protein